MNDRITIDPAVLAGKPVIKGTRLAVEFILGLLAQGWTLEDGLKEYDHIKREDLRLIINSQDDLLAHEASRPLSRLEE